MRPDFVEARRYAAPVCAGNLSGMRKPVFAAAAALLLLTVAGCSQQLEGMPAQPSESPAPTTTSSAQVQLDDSETAAAVEACRAAIIDDIAGDPAEAAELFDIDYASDTAEVVADEAGDVYVTFSPRPAHDLSQQVTCSIVDGVAAGEWRA